MRVNQVAAIQESAHHIIIHLFPHRNDIRLGLILAAAATVLLLLNILQGVLVNNLLVPGRAPAVTASMIEKLRSVVAIRRIIEDHILVLNSAIEWLLHPVPVSVPLYLIWNIDVVDIAVRIDFAGIAVRYQVVLPPIDHELKGLADPNHDIGLEAV